MSANHMQSQGQWQDTGVKTPEPLQRKPLSKPQKLSCLRRILVVPVSSHVAWDKFLYLICEMGKSAPCGVII